MLRFIAYRLVWVIVTVWTVATLSFFLVRAAPGDPFENEMRAIPPAVREARRREYHLDQPLWAQYLLWLRGVATGDLGPSMKYPGKTVTEMIAQTLPTSMALGSAAMILALTLGLTTGVIAAARQNSAWDYSLMALAVLGISLPNFILAMLWIIIFVFTLGMFPLAGWETYSHVALPALALGLPFAARISRLARVGMLDVLSEDFIRTAQAKGLSERQIIIKHALKGSILPVASYLGPAFALVLTGSLVVEKIFFVPGMGTIFVQSATNRDYYVVLGTVVVYSALLCFFNFLVDLSYAFLDPRIDLEDAA